MTTLAAADEEEAASPATPGLLLAALGVVFGDIGTSPIYTFGEAVRAGATSGSREAAVLGILSLVFWAIALIVTLKYVLVVMRADNGGEGGIVALMSLALSTGGQDRLRRLILIAGVLGTAFFFGDGTVTPAISVLSAVEGLKTIAPGSDRLVVPLTAVILAALFALQSRGSGSIGRYFGPVMALWFATLGGAGAVGVIGHPAILRALDPRYGFFLLTTSPGIALPVLGNIFLALTGAEALYADMGQFRRGVIRADWFGLVLPALVLSYLGQGARVLSDPAAMGAPFFHQFPGWTLYPAVLLATAATIIASQAVISGAFAIAQQAMQFGFLPRLKVRATSATSREQVYLPLVNVLLAIGVIGLVVGFRSSSNLAGAYGIAVGSTMLATTLLVAVLARRGWRWSRALTGGLLGPIFLVELAFLAANLMKIPHGGWYPLLIGGLLVALMTTWRTGRNLLRERLAATTPPLSAVMRELAAGEIKRVAGTAIYLASSPDQLPTAAGLTVRWHKVLHERVLLVTVQVEPVPRIARGQRVAVEELGQGLARVSVRFGFIDKLDLEATLARAGLVDDEAVYFSSRVTAQPSGRPDLAAWRDQIFAFLTRNSRSHAETYQLPPERLLENVIRIEI